MKAACQPALCACPVLFYPCCSTRGFKQLSQCDSGEVLLVWHLSDPSGVVPSGCRVLVDQRWSSQLLLVSATQSHLLTVVVTVVEVRALSALRVSPPVVVTLTNGSQFKVLHVDCGLVLDKVPRMEYSAQSLSPSASGPWGGLSCGAPLSLRFHSSPVHGFSTTIVVAAVGPHRKSGS